LIGINGGHLRFDFVISSHDTLAFIECQGAQHYKPVKYFGGDESFEIRKKNDEIKKKWVDEKGYKLIEIPHALHSYDKFLELLVKEHIIELANRVSE
jgi:hypothetical protein